MNDFSTHCFNGNRNRKTESFLLNERRSTTSSWGRNATSRTATRSRDSATRPSRRSSRPSSRQVELTSFGNSALVSAVQREFASLTGQLRNTPKNLGQVLESWTFYTVRAIENRNQLSELMTFEPFSPQKKQCKVLESCNIQLFQSGHSFSVVQTVQCY